MSQKFLNPARPPIARIPRLDRHTLAELILRNGESLRPQPVCWHCERGDKPLFPYEGKILCLQDLAMTSVGKL